MYQIRHLQAVIHEICNDGVPKADGGALDAGGDQADVGTPKHGVSHNEEGAPDEVGALDKVGNPVEGSTHDEGGDPDDVSAPEEGVARNEDGALDKVGALDEVDAPKEGGDVDEDGALEVECVIDDEFPDFIIIQKVLISLLMETVPKSLAVKKIMLLK